jgi:murein DD-endopeptidase MepM/ murein hydrolase activator NlpD
MHSNAKNILAKAGEIQSSHNTMERIANGMTPYFSGTLPELLTRRLLDMKKKHEALYEKISQYSGKIDYAADNYDWSDQEIAGWAARLGVGVAALVGDGAAGGNGTSVSRDSAAYPVEGFTPPLDKSKYGFGIDRGIASDKATGGHSGYDFVGTEGTAIKASTEGKVVVCKLDSGTAKNSSTGYGNYVIVEYQVGDKYYYVTYAHLKENPNLAIGSTVSEGSVIGQMGQTGGANGTSHLHLDVRCAKDPTQKLSSLFDKKQYDFVDPETFFNDIGVEI